MAYVVTTDNKQMSVAPKNGKLWSLKELQDIVGGYIEIVYLRDGGLLVIDEEGKLKNKPINTWATKKYGRNDVIVGAVLYVPESEMNTID